MPVKIIAEIGINHNSDIDIAKRLIDVAVSAGVDYVKFQKRNPDVCVPEDQKWVMRETPWGRMSYLEYRHKMEFEKEEFDEIERYCKGRIGWFASPWDIPSLEFLQSYGSCAFIKVPSALITNKDFLGRLWDSKKQVILSTGASTDQMINDAIDIIGSRKIACLMHCTSTYPGKTEELNLRCIETLNKSYPDIPIGFSNHHPGTIYMPIAVALGAKMIEFHITLDRAMWGTDQSASIEPEGVHKLVKYIRGCELALGDGVKRIYDSEVPIMKKLRIA